MEFAFIPLEHKAARPGVRRHFRVGDLVRDDDGARVMCLVSMTMSFASIAVGISDGWTKARLGRTPNLC